MSHHEWSLPPPRSWGGTRDKPSNVCVHGRLPWGFTFSSETFVTPHQHTSTISLLLCLTRHRSIYVLIYKIYSNWKILHIAEVVPMYRVSCSLSIFVTQHFLSCASEEFSVKRANVKDHHQLEPPCTSFHCAQMEFRKITMYIRNDLLVVIFCICEDL